MAVFNVQATELIGQIAADLRKQGVKAPDWTMFVKTGPHKERAPDSSDWFFERMASVLYRIYKDGPVGTESLRTYYGGKKRRGVRKAHFKKAGGKIIRVCLQQLEKQGLIKKSKKGRIVTGKGHSYINSKAKEAAFAAKQHVGEKAAAKEEKKEEKKTEEEKRVEEELKKQEKKEKDKERAKEEEKKREKKKEEKKEAEKKEEDA